MRDGAKCKNCGSRDTVVAPKRALEKAIKEAGSADRGVVSLGVTDFMPTDPRTIGIIIDLAIRILEWIFRDKEEYVYCRACGYYEKL